MDNRVALFYINHMGGTQSKKLCQIALEFWEWCINRGITVHAVHLPGRMNLIADFKFRHYQNSSKWMILPQVFKALD